MWGKRNCLSFETAVGGIEPPSPRLTDRRSTARPPLPIFVISPWRPQIMSSDASQLILHPGCREKVADSPSTTTTAAKQANGPVEHREVRVRSIKRLHHDPEGDKSRAYILEKKHASNIQDERDKQRRKWEMSSNVSTSERPNEITEYVESACCRTERRWWRLRELSSIPYPQTPHSKHAKRWRRTVSRWS